MWILSTKEKVKSHWTRWLLEREELHERAERTVDGVNFLYHGDFMERIYGFKGHFCYGIRWMMEKKIH